MTYVHKTIPTQSSLDEFIDTVENPDRRADAKQLLALMQEVTGEQPRMWGPSMIGFGSYHYKYATGHEGDALKVGFSPRKAALVLYGLVTYEGNPENEALLEKLGPHTRGKGCVYVKSLQNLDYTVLRQMIRNSFAQGDYDATNR